MSVFFPVLAALCAMAFFYGVLSLRMWVKKESEFRGTCASQNPYLRKEGGKCGYCGKVVPKATKEVEKDSLTAESAEGCAVLAKKS